MKKWVTVFLFFCSFSCQEVNSAGKVVESVKLHFDQPSYCLGEQMLFAAYLQNRDTVKQSGVLYVEFVSPEGIVWKRDKYKLSSSGHCYGAIQLDSAYGSGLFEVRAYTRKMLNYGNRNYLSMFFPVYQCTLKEWPYRTFFVRERMVRTEKKKQLKEDINIERNKTTFPSVVRTKIITVDGHRKLCLTVDDEAVLSVAIRRNDMSDDSLCSNIYFPRRERLNRKAFPTVERKLSISGFLLNESGKKTDDSPVFSNKKFRLLFYNMDGSFIADGGINETSKRGTFQFGLPDFSGKMYGRFVPADPSLYIYGNAKDSLLSADSYVYVKGHFYINNPPELSSRPLPEVVFPVGVRLKKVPPLYYPENYSLNVNDLLEWANENAVVSTRILPMGVAYHFPSYKYSMGCLTTLYAVLALYQRDELPVDVIDHISFSLIPPEYANNDSVRWLMKTFDEMQQLQLENLKSFRLVSVEHILRMIDKKDLPLGEKEVSVLKTIPEKDHRYVIIWDIFPPNEVVLHPDRDSPIRFTTIQGFVPALSFQKSSRTVMWKPEVLVDSTGTAVVDLPDGIRFPVTVSVEGKSKSGKDISLCFGIKEPF